MRVKGLSITQSDKEVDNLRVNLNEMKGKNPDFTTSVDQESAVMFTELDQNQAKQLAELNTLKANL